MSASSLPLISAFGIMLNFRESAQRRLPEAVRGNDKANYHFVRSYFNINVGYPLHYDLVINTETNGFEGAAHVIYAALQSLMKRERTGERLTLGR